MTPFAWLLGFLLPACGATGAHGLPMPLPFDIAHIERPASPNSALAAPAGFRPPPDIVTPVYAIPPELLFAAVRAVAAARPRVFPATEDAAGLRAQWVARSRIMNYPDLVAVKVRPARGGGSELILYSHSVYGYSDFGVNLDRVRSWLALLRAASPHTAHLTR